MDAWHTSNADLSEKERALDTAMNAVREAHFAGIEPLLSEQKACEKELQAIMKARKGAIFDGRERVELDHGMLVHGREDRVRIPKNALALAEEQGLEEAVKVAKSIDREAVERWPDERLILIGAERKPKDVYSYEITKRSA